MKLLGVIFYGSTNLYSVLVPAPNGKILRFPYFSTAYFCIFIGCIASRCSFYAILLLAIASLKVALLDFFNTRSSLDAVCCFRAACFVLKRASRLIC